MKKNLLISNIVFSGLIFVSFILAIVLIIISTSTNNIIVFNSVFIPITIINGLCAWTSVIGVFVCSIIMLIKSKSLNQSKSFCRAVSILGIVASSIAFLFVLITLIISIPALALMADSLIVATFGMSISLLIKAKKTNELIVDNKESTVEQPKQ